MCCWHKTSLPLTLPIAALQAQHQQDVSYLAVLLESPHLTETQLRDALAQAYELPVTESIINPDAHIPDDIRTILAPWQQQVLPLSFAENQLCVALADPTLIATIKAALATFEYELTVSLIGYQQLLPCTLPSATGLEKIYVADDEFPHCAVFGAIAARCDCHTKHRISILNHSNSITAFVCVSMVYCCRGQNRSWIWRHVWVRALKFWRDLILPRRRLPQDGQFKFELRTKAERAIRVSTCPHTARRKKSVLRILDPARCTNRHRCLGFGGRTKTIITANVSIAARHDSGDRTHWQWQNHDTLHGIESAK